MKTSALLRLSLLALALSLPLSCLAASAPSPLFKPDTMLSSDQVRRGMPALGKTVFQGVKIEEFHLEILGVVDKFNAGDDLILAKVLDGPVVARKAGIIGGMSGSPVYIGGKLIGAIAYGWPFMNEPVAGITPINSMLRSWDKQAAPPPARAAHPDPGVQLAGRWITRAQVATQPDRPFADAHTVNLQPAAPALLCSGFSPRGLAGLEKLFQPYGLRPLAGPGSMRDPVPATIEPGSSMGVQLVSGDFDISAVGTVTHVEGKRVLGFGHPFLKIGAVDFPLTTGYVHDILSSLYDSNKMASAMEVVGSLRQDTQFSVGGELGPKPAMIPVTVDINDVKSAMKFSYHTQVANNLAFTPMLIYLTLDSAMQAALDPGALGMVEYSFTVEGAKGARYSRSDTEIFEETPEGALLWPLFDALGTFNYNFFTPQDIKSVRMSATVYDGRVDFATVERAYAEQPFGKAGQPLNIHVVLRPWGKAPVEEVMTLNLPADMPATELQVAVGSGAYGMDMRYYLDGLVPTFNSLEGLLREMEGMEHYNELLALAPTQRTSMGVGDWRLPDLPLSVQGWLEWAGRPATGSGYSLLLAKRTLPYMVTDATIISVPVESRTGARPAITTSADDGDDVGDGEEGEETTEARAPSTAAQPAVGALPSFPSPRLWWAASGLRPDLAARLHPPQRLAGKGPVRHPATTPLSLPRPFVRQPEAPPGGAPGKPPTPPHEPRAHDEPVVQTADEDLDDEETGDEEEEEETPADGEGKVLRQPTVWTQDTVDDFSAGTAHGLAVTSDGYLSPVPSWTSAANLPDQLARAAAVTADGAVYVGTTDPARVLRVKDGKTETVWTADTFSLTALLARPDGSLLAACSPGGKLVALTAAGKASPFATLPVTYIWDLIAGPDGAVYAATGPGGAIYRITADGKAAPYARLPEDHVLCLAWQDQALVAGTAGEGGVYLITGPDAVRSLLGLSTDDVTCVAVDKQGAIWAGTLPMGEIFYVPPGGGARSLWIYPDGVVYSLLPTEQGMLVGTGPFGALYLFPDPDTQAVAWSDLTTGSFTRLLSGPSGRLAALNSMPGGLWTAPATGPLAGTYLSSVLDAERRAEWGKLSWSGEMPAGSALEVQCRSGNTQDPDDGAWTGWAPIAASGDTVGLPAAHYLQYQLKLQAASPQAVPRLDRLALTYLTTNLPPTATLDDPTTGAALKGEYSLSWSASDDDGDEVTSNLYVFKPGKKDWELLTGPTAETTYDWDTTELDAGKYQLKLVVDDRRSNPTGWFTREAFSRDVFVDNDAPTLVAKLVTDADTAAVSVAGSAADPGSGIASVAWKVKENAEPEDTTVEEPAGDDDTPAAAAPEGDNADPAAADDDATAADVAADDDDDTGDDEEETEEPADLWTAAVPTEILFTPGVMSFTIPAEQIPEEAAVLVIRVIDEAGNATDEEVRVKPEPTETDDVDQEEPEEGEAVGWLDTLRIALAPLRWWAQRLGPF